LNAEQRGATDAISRAIGPPGPPKGRPNSLTEIDKKSLSERDICTKFITPAVRDAGWDLVAQIREEVGFTKGRIIVRGKLVTRGKRKQADYVLYYKPNIPLALIEAKDNNHYVKEQPRIDTNTHEW
jgi:type I restriction enzyme, R subunit